MEDCDRLRSDLFFRAKLLRLTSRAEVEEFLNELEADQAKIIEHAGELNWLQRGGIPYDQIWNLSYRERQIMMKQGEQRMKAMKETKLPIV